MFRDLQYVKNLTNYEFDEQYQYLVLATENSKNDLSIMKNSNIIFYALFFPKIILEQHYYEDGFLVLQMQDDVYSTVIPQMSKNIKESSFLKTNDIKSMYIFVDGLSKYVEPFLENLYEVIDQNTTVCGGGAGSITLEQSDMLYTQTNSYQDCALLIYSKYEISIGVDHGWKKFDGPFISTHGDKNILHSIDFQDALSFYEKILNKQLNKENFFDTAKYYPLGIEKFNNEIIVRDPIAILDKSLVLVGEIDKNSVIYILKGEKNNLLEAAKNAAIQANAKKKHQFVFIIDCVSRSMFLEDDFVQELQVIQEHTKETPKRFGVLSLGEIANKNHEFIEFYNKTCVISTL